MKFVVYMESPGGVRHTLTEFDTEVEAMRFCDIHHWSWLDENRFEWDLDYKEVEDD